MNFYKLILLFVLTMSISACGGSSSDLVALSSALQTSSLAASSDLLGTWNLVYAESVSNGITRDDENTSTDPLKQVHFMIESNQVTVSSYCENHTNHQMEQLISTSPAELKSDRIVITAESRGAHPGCTHSARLDQRAFSYRMPSVDQLEFINDRGEVHIRLNRIHPTP